MKNIISITSIHDGLTRQITHLTEGKIKIKRIGGITGSEFISSKENLEAMLRTGLWDNIIYDDKQPEPVKLKEKKSGFEGELEIKEKPKQKHKVVVAQASLM